MENTKRNKILYWVLTGLFLLPSAGTAIPELFMMPPESMIQATHTLSYPMYLFKILGLAKILGTLAIVTGYSRRLKEWAYAGFTFEFLGATASHLLAGDSAHAPFPFVFFVLLMASYYFWNKTLESRKYYQSA